MNSKWFLTRLIPSMAVILVAGFEFSTAGAGPAGRQPLPQALPDNGNKCRLEEDENPTRRGKDEQPLANGESDLTFEDQPVTTDVLANDLCLGDKPLTVQIVAGPQHGSAAPDHQDEVTYRPSPNFSGPDGYTYQVCDADGDCSQASVLVSVEAVNDPPVAADDPIAILADCEAAIDVLTNDRDPDGEALLLEAFDPASALGGLVARLDSGTPQDLRDDRLAYRPPAALAGLDEFTYTVSDGAAAATARVIVTLGESDDGPIAYDDLYSTSKDSRLEVPDTSSVLENDVADDGATLTAILVSSASFGALEFHAEGTFSYTPQAGFSGEDAFTYKANDGFADSNVATVRIHVNEVNYAPFASDDSYSVGQLEVLNVTAPGVLENDADANGDSLKSALFTPPEHGSVALNADGSLTYSPGDSFVGTDRFTYQAYDEATASNPATVEVSVIDQILPTVDWIAPTEVGGIYDVGYQLVRLEVEARDNVEVARVHFFRWDAANLQFVDIGIDDSPPFQVELNTEELNPEWNQVFAIAYDARGNRSERQFIWLFQVGSRLFLPLVGRQP